MYANDWIVKALDLFRRAEQLRPSGNSDAILGSVLLLFIGDVERKGMLALWAFLSYCGALGLFAFSTVFSWSVFLLGILGLANALQAVMRQTAFHLLTPDHLRGRAFSVFNMFSQGANSVGAAEIGFLAAVWGSPGALLFGCAAGALLTVGCWAGLPALRRFGIDPLASPAISDS